MFIFSTKVLNIQNPHASATPRMRMHLGVVGLHLLHSPPICECKRWSPMTPKSNTLSWPRGPLHSHLVANPILGLQQSLLSLYLFTLFVVLCANHAIVVFTIGLLIIVNKWNYNWNKSKHCASYNHRPLVEKTNDVNAKATRLKLNVT